MTHKTKYLLHLADNALILGQRLAEWCGHGPVLEQDIAITNIALDMIGRARLIYQYTAELTKGEKNEDDFAFLRTEKEYLNTQIAELPNHDFAHTIVKQFFIDAFEIQYFEALVKSRDVQLSGLAEKTLKEIKYHLRYSREWMLRLGDGTEESNERMQKAVDALWMYTEEMFIPSDFETKMIEDGVAPDPAQFKLKWNETVSKTIEEATLQIPEIAFFHSGGKQGVHTEHMGHLLTDLQYMQRAFPNATW